MICARLIRNLRLQLFDAPCEGIFTCTEPNFPIARMFESTSGDKHRITTEFVSQPHTLTLGLEPRHHNRGHDLSSA